MHASFEIRTESQRFSDPQILQVVFKESPAFGDTPVSRPLEEPWVGLSRGESAFHTISNETRWYVGMGSKRPETLCDMEKLGGMFYSLASNKKYPVLGVDLSSYDKEFVVAFVRGMRLKSWKGQLHRSSMKQQSSLKTIHILHPKGDELAAAFTQDFHLVDSVAWARNLINEPGNFLTPEIFVNHIRALAAFGLEVTILDYKELLEKGLNALAGVGKGSVHPPYLAILEWKGHLKRKDQPNSGGAHRGPLAFVGKGVTFDTGGISLKPSLDMDKMKSDMTGAAVVCGLLRSAALKNVPLHLVGVVGLAENMPSGTAQRPGDVVCSYSGKTIEVLDTDAEGRLVLADALSYTQKIFNPGYIIDLATLTGAVTVALGSVYGGLFSNNDVLAHQLSESGLKVSEPLWRLPLHPDYDKAIESDIADLANIAPRGYGAGSSVGAQFLQHFVDEKTPWAHLDIASTSYTRRDSDVFTKGGIAFGLRLLDDWMKLFY